MPKRWQKAIIVGASSGIGEALSRKLAQSGCSVAMVARRIDTLKHIAHELDSSSCPTPLCYEHDVHDLENITALFQQICHNLGGLDLFIYSAGVMPAVHPEKSDFALDKNIIDTNILGATAWLNEAADRFQTAQAGTLAGVSSVAADRGRRSMIAYAASKAYMDTYLEGMRNRLSRYNVKVATIKPGPVDTPLLDQLDKGRLPMLISADKAAEIILNGLHRGGEIYVPGKWKPVMKLIQCVPSPLFSRLNL